jgi:hypothetical protein
MCASNYKGVVNMELIALIIALGLFMLYAYERERENREERQDLMDRLMAKDYREYSESKEPLRTFEPINYNEQDEYMMELEDRKM